MELLDSTRTKEKPATTSGRQSNPLFSFGVIADVQYADIEDRPNFSKTKIRHYRNALELVRDAVRAWNQPNERIEHIVQLGDLLDGFNTEKGQAESDASCHLLFSELAKCGVPVHHLIGNHELYNYNRRELYERGFLTGYELSKNNIINRTENPNGVSTDALHVSRCIKEASFKSFCKSLSACPERYPSYYQFSPHEGFRFLFLDTYDLSVLGYDTDSERYKESVALLRTWNQNEQWNSPDGLGDKARYVAFNGGVGKDQLKWLRAQLVDAAAQNDKVIIFGHISIHPNDSDPVCLLWNYEEVIELIHQFSSVVAVMCGHAHASGYVRDAKGIHHVVMPGIVEVPAGQNGYATVDVYADRIHVRSTGIMGSLNLEF